MTGILHYYRVPRILMGAILIGSPVAAIACCPSGGSGTPAAKGLGESSPQTTNLSVDPEWGVYEFLRDGISYLQINDSRGVVRAAVGRIDSTAWVMPMGSDVDSVTIAPSSTVGTIVYSSDHFVVRALKGTNGVSWVIVPVSKN
ncbi:hypothetical protein OCJ37_14460 [Xanthomonas sp. AM6]|uniref:hypothetical protein n=1 Tax=Xanthomonas sp. AM6 TaxID=2982531 RepID=UPI0021D863E6|nr:hypothetical protein [Xanthomonas sp. AM6]UYB51188.1 hypothetical protein OCJ37_14460 [Xanthomonas sp. AM6]